VVAFTLQAVKPRYLTGEPIVIVVTQHGTATLYDTGWEGLGVQGPGFEDRMHFRVLIDRGAGFGRFRRKLLYASTQEPLQKTAVEDGHRTEFVLSFDAAIDDVVFPRPGMVRLMIEYEDDVVGIIRSNVVTLRIANPKGAERRAYDRIRALPGNGAPFWLELTQREDAPTLSDAASQHVLADFPKSVYVLGVRTRALAYDAAQMSPADFRAAAKTIVRDAKGSQFEADAWALLAAAYEASGDERKAKASWRHILRRFPTRDAAVEAREALAPDDDDDDQTEAPAGRPH
jgi:hypothetical protein